MKLVRARRLNGAVAWVLASFAVLSNVARASDDQVVINEILYDPVLGGAGLEFVELRNIGPIDVDLGGWSFADGIELTIPQGTVLPANGYLICSPSPAEARAFYGLPGNVVLGPYQGRLDNEGEIVSIASRAGEVVNRIHFDNEAPWPTRADGAGVSIEFTGADTRNDLSFRWAASHGIGGTPARANSTATNLPQPPAGANGSFVEGLINEVRPGNGAGALGFVELFNPRSEPLDVGSFFLVSNGGLNAVLPPGTVLAPGELRSFDELELGAEVPADDMMVLVLEPDGVTLADALEVEPRGSGNSVGRYPDGSGRTFVMTTPTPGSANTYAYESPVVINEIHFHPAFVPADDDCPRRCADVHQWLELWNRSAADVDLTGWRLSRGVDFDFAPGTMIGAGEALVVAASVDAFRATFADIPNVVGDWSGRLSYGSNRINLRDPLGNRVDTVRYGDGKPLNDETPIDGEDDRTFRGSPWPSEADGSGRTLELLHPDLDNDLGLAWRASEDTGGTPGEINSVFTAAPAPAIGNVSHAPAVPRSTDPVTITCRISSRGALATSEVVWSASSGDEGTSPLRDNGLAGDVAAGDGEYAATIPAQPDGEVVSFRVRAVDTGGRESLAPAQPVSLPYSGFQGNYFLYEVDDSTPPDTGNTVYRIVMRERDLEELSTRPVASDVLLPATLIAGDSIRHVAGVRYRGENSRNLPNRSYRVNLPTEDPLEGVEHINFNAGNGNEGDSGTREVVAANLFRRAGVPCSQTWPCVLRFAGEVSREFDTRYVRKETFDDQFLARSFGGSDQGNFYRARDPQGPGDGNLAYLGEEADSYRDFYPKRNNEDADDWTDLIALCRAFDPDETPPAEFPDALEALIDVEQWMRFFTTMSLLGNTDGGIWNRTGEDYFLYHVPADSGRPDAGKWLILPWDLEEAFSASNETLFRPEVPAIERFLRHPRFAPVYYEHLARLTRGVFSRSSMRREFAFIAGQFPPDDVFEVTDRLDAFVARRNGFVDQAVPDEIVAGGTGTTLAGDLAIEEGDLWRFFRGRDDPPGAPGAWTQLGYNDSGWEEGPTGIGFGDGDDATVLDDMGGFNGYTTVFARRPFQVANPATVATLTLLMDYDDGFVAYINGVEIARELAPGDPGDLIEADDISTADHEAGAFESFDVTDHIDDLVAGTNVLAVVGLNASGFSSDFSLIPALSIGDGGPGGPSLSAGCGDLIYVSGETARLEGFVDASFAASVVVNGLLAESTYVTSGPGPYGLAWEIALDLEPGDTTARIDTHAAAGGAGPVTSSRTVVLRRASGFTAVTGTLDDDTVWTAAESPYRLDGPLGVPPGVTLTIEPGVTVLANGNAGITVEGTLIADGTAEEPIHISAYDCGARWNGIVFEDTGTGGGSPLHTLRHCHLEYGESLQNAPGFITVEASRLLLEGTTVADIDSNAIDGTDCVLEVRDSLIDTIFEGIHCNTSVSTVVGTTIRRMRGDSDAIDFDGSGTARSRIENCLIEDSTDDGLDLGACSVDIIGNVFRGVQDKAISIEGNGAQGGCSVRWNLIHDSGTALAIKDGQTISDGHHNTITRCQEGIDLYAKDAGPEGGHAEMHSLIVWNNVVDVRADELSTITITHSDIGGAALFPGTGNILAVPRFVDPGADFYLRADSPCLGTGLDGTDMGAIPFDGPAEPRFLRGDVNEDAVIDISDPFLTLLYLFLDRPGPACLDRLDTDDSGVLELTDALYALNFLFTQGPLPRAPFPEAGTDPTPDGLECGF